MHAVGTANFGGASLWAHSHHATLWYWAAVGRPLRRAPSVWVVEYDARMSGDLATLWAFDPAAEFAPVHTETVPWYEDWVFKLFRGSLAALDKSHQWKAQKQVFARLHGSWIACPRRSRRATTARTSRALPRTRTWATLPPRRCGGTLIRGFRGTQRRSRSRRARGAMPQQPTPASTARSRFTTPSRGELHATVHVDV